MMMRTALLLLLLIIPPANAGLDAKPGEAYRWRILLRLPRHPQFDAAFQANLTRELKAALEPKLGLLAAVEVTDSAKAEDAIAKEFHALGWPAFEKTRPLDDIKHHGFSIEMKDGAYRLTARQYDGFTGLTSPLIRTRTVHSADQIPRAAALLIEPDFGLAATVEKYEKENNLLVTLILRGHNLAPMAERVKTGDIFAVSTVRERTEKGISTRTATPANYTLLKVLEAPKDGRCPCQILTRFANPFGRGAESAAGIRALKLPTVTAPVKVRLVDRAGKPHSGASRLVLTAGEGDPGQPSLASFEWRDGLHRSTRAFKNVAVFAVGVGNGQDRPQQFPVAILADDAVITLSFDVDAKAEKQAEFFADCRDLRGRIADLNLSQVAMVSQLNQLIDTGRRKDALAKAVESGQSFTEKEKQLTDELKTMRGQSGANDAGAKESLDSCARALEFVRNGQKELEQTVEKLKELNKPSAIAGAFEKEFHVKDIRDRIRTNVERGNVLEAIALLDQLIAEFPKEASYRDEREKLNALWAPKSDAQRAARDSWRLLDKAKDAEEVLEACKAVRKAMIVLRDHQDLLGMLKLHNSFERPTVELSKQMKDLERLPDEHPDKDVKRLKLSEAFKELEDCANVVKVLCDDLKKSQKK